VTRAVCWYLKRDDVYLVDDAGEFKYGLEHEKVSSHRLLNVADASEFIQNHRGKVVLIADMDAYSHWQTFLPKPVSVDSSGTKGYLLLYY
jgi:4-amino-4-deoxy-L-arabinose transferase